MFRSSLIPLGVSVIIAYCGVGLIKTALLIGGTVGEFACGALLILVGAWMAFSILFRRRVLR